MLDKSNGVKQRNDTFLLECDCNQMEHGILFTKYDDDEEIWLQMCMCQSDNLWTRIKKAWSYLKTGKNTFISSDSLFDYDKMDELVEWYKSDKRAS